MKKKRDKNCSCIFCHLFVWLKTKHEFTGGMGTIFVGFAVCEVEARRGHADITFPSSSR